MGSTILPAERQQKLLQMAQREQVISVSKAAEELDVHEMTIRRDLDMLAEQRLLERVHGGARLPRENSIEVGYHLRLQERREIKERLARAALTFIEEGDSVAVDASTTCLALARILPKDSVTAIVTNLEAANALAETGTPFILAGGSYYPKSHSFVGALTAATLAKLNPDKVFFSGKGFTVQSGFADAYLPEADIKERLIAQTGFAVALMDHSKFGVRALNTFAGPKDVDVVITDQEPAADALLAFSMAGTSVHVTRQEAADAQDQGG